MSGAISPFLGAAAAVALLAAALPDRLPHILWNASASLPIGLYALSPPGPLSVGDLVAVELPPEHADWAAERGYLGSAALLLKRAAALPGAEVCRIGDMILIDGGALATASAADSQGRPMPDWQGCVVMAEGQVFLLQAETHDSLDGRYFGLTDAAAIVARARPIWTRGG